MNNGKRSQVFGKASIAMMLALGGFALLQAAPVRAQDATLPTMEVNITLNQAPVRTALDTLFKSAGLNYTIDPGVTGLVSASLRAVPFDVALRSILRSCDPPLAYTVDDNVYDIHPRQQVVDVTGPGTQGGTSTVAAAQAPTDNGPDTSTQIVQLKLNYANALLLMRYALSGTSSTGSGVIPTLTMPMGGSGNGQQGGSNGMSGGMGGMSGGMGGMSGGMGGMSSGMGGMSSGMSSMGGMSGGMGGMTF